MSFPGGSVVKNPPANAGHFGQAPRSGRQILWRRKWQPTPIFLPRKPHTQRSLEGYNPWGCKRVGRNLLTKRQNLQQHRRATIRLWLSGVNETLQNKLTKQKGSSVKKDGQTLYTEWKKGCQLKIAGNQRNAN